MVDGSHLRRAAEECHRALTEHTDADWTLPVPGLDLTVAEVVAHAAEGCLWFAIDLAAAGPDLGTIEHRVKTARPPTALAATVLVHATVLAAVIDTTPPHTRAFHPMGATDASGFAAMACDELLIHTDDAITSLGATFAPDPTVAHAVLARLFPWIDPGAEPWQRLRWANGRIALDDRPRLDGWAWHHAPLADWDHTIPEPVDGLS